MEFGLSEEQKMLQSTVRDFALKEVEPVAAEIDKADEFPHDLMNRFKEMDFLGLAYPTEYGGGGMGYLAMVLAVEELARSSSVVAGWIGTQCNCMESIYQFGTEEQKQKYLVPLASSEKLGCFAFSEPATGSDPRAIETTAKLDGDHYVINGQKRFITRANVSQIMTLFAMTEDKRVSAFIVETDTPGYSTGPAWDKLGSRGSDTCDVFLDDMRIPKDNLLGGQGNGYRILLQTVAIGKLGWSAQGVGMAQAALDEAVKYAKERIVQGKPIIELLNIQWLLAEIAVKVEACRLMTYKAAWLKDQGEDIVAAVATSKFFSAVYSLEAINQALQVHGSYGYTKDFKIERLYRDAKLNHVIEGSLETQRLIIANAVIRQSA